MLREKYWYFSTENGAVVVWEMAFDGAACAVSRNGVGSRSHEDGQEGR